MNSPDNSKIRQTAKIIEGLDKYEAIVKNAYTSHELLAKKFKPIKWIEPGILPEGLSILAGRPKIGKGWLGLSIAVSVSKGSPALGVIAVEVRRVAFLALEDGERRLQSRLMTMDKEGSANLKFINVWERGPAGLAHLKQWIVDEEHDLVVVDTLARILGKRKDSRYSYQDDYDQITELKQISDKAGVALLLVTHTRKANADDFLDAVTGTTGVTAPADIVLVLKRKRKSPEATLDIAGRDVDERTLELHQDATTGWALVGEAEEDADQSNERQEVLDVLRKSDKPLSPQEISEVVNKKSAAVQYLLGKLTEEGVVRKEGYGEYAYIP